MDTYDSDSSDADEDEYTQTTVLLGYASKDPTDDNISKLGGYPTWLDEKFPPPASLANCKVCNNNMSLLIQLNGDMPEHFPGHERRLYIQACRQKQCRRKEGSIRGFRGTRIDPVQSKAAQEKEMQSTEPVVEATPKPNLGNAIFGGSSTNASTTQANPFSTSTPSTANPFSGGQIAAASNPFSNNSLAAKPPQRPTDPNTNSLSETFASKVRISSSSGSQTPKPIDSPPWPSQSSFPPPYPAYYLDADYETLSPENASPIPASAQISNDFDVPEAGNSAGGSSSKEDKDAFESSLDKTFQKFADRLAHHPDQVLRYELRGSPLLYSKLDAVGKMLAPYQTHYPGSDSKVQSKGAAGASGMPRCGNCGADRVFEMQLAPQAIAELEVEEMGLEGMDWGTVILGVCGQDCVPQGTKTEEGEVGWVEEWVGVQWEEIVGKGGR
ncbi:MAG: hypothetical protein M1822_007464 [Bathelium mastoideum]|nr:MAG: hypothetical protein M1822_007464 [Bathelium mastoideum]